MSLYERFSQLERKLGVLDEKDMCEMVAYLNALEKPNTTTVAKLIKSYYDNDPDAKEVFGSTLYDGIRRCTQVNGFKIEILKLPKRLQRALYVYMQERRKREKDLQTFSTVTRR